MRLSLVVPCFNEQDGVPQLARALVALRPALGSLYELELVFVDDGSTDRTRAVLEEHFGHLGHVRLLSHERNRGLGAALRTGFAAATGTWTATTDSDCTYDLLELPKMLRLAEAGADVVIASPYHPSGGVRNVPAYRIFLSRNLSRLYALVLSSDICTYTSLFRVYRAELVQQIPFRSDGFLAMAQLAVGVLLSQAKVAEHPTVLSVRNYGESKAAILRLMAQHVRFLGHLAWFRLRGRLTLEHVFGAPALVPSEGRAARAYRTLPPDEELAGWNRRLNQHHGMAVLSEHPSRLVRWHESDRKRRVIRMVQPSSHDLVIEVGCERGGLSTYLADRCRYLVCVDIDEEVVNAARQQLVHRRVGHVIADAQALPFKNRCAQIAVSAHTLEHLPSPLAGLKELARITAPAGRIAINVPNDRWVLIVKRLVFRVLRLTRLFRGISPDLAPGHLWVFHPGLLRRIARGLVTLGPISFNPPFFTNVFTVAQPLGHAEGGDPDRGQRH